MAQWHFPKQPGTAKNWGPRTVGEHTNRQTANAMRVRSNPSYLSVARTHHLGGGVGVRQRHLYGAHIEHDISKH